MEDIVVKEFGPELAGQRVGWVTAHDDPREDVDFVHVNIAVGTVATGGGFYSYVDMSKLPGGQGQGYHHDSTTGIVDGFSIEANISRTEGIHPHGGAATDRQERGKSPESLFLGGASRVVKIAEEDKQWALSAPAIKDNIREVMEQAGVFSHYPSLYYWLNGMMCHGYFLDRAGISIGEQSSMFIIDPEMKDATHEQIGAADKILEGLDGNIEADELMRNRLTVNSDVPAEEIPDTFVTTRRELEERERAMSEAATKLIVPGLVYSPVGQGPGSRSFPYMGAYPGDERANFGIELDALKAGNVSVADRELIRELSELRSRRVWAGHGSSTLMGMYVIESMAASISPPA